MMRRTSELLICTVSLLLFSTRILLAQTPNLEPEKTPSGGAPQQKQQTPNAVDPARQTAPTLFGATGTGLFGTMGTRTLRRNEFTFGAFWNNYDRDPGDLDINQVPVNFAYGLLNRWEVFVNIDFFQQVTSEQPLSLSGYQFNGVRSAFGSDPLVAFGRPSGGTGGPAAFFPFTGALAGGILPPPGFFLGPQYIASRPSFYNELPFFGPAFFISKDRGFDVRRSANGTGNLTLGSKFNLIDPDRAFSLAVAGILRLPTTRSFHGIANGRGTGEIDIGPILILGQSFRDQRLRFSENIGYIHSGDPGKDGLKLLDRRNQLILNGGVEIAAHQKLVLVGELNGTVYVGSGTPNLNPINPLDLVLGLRYFAFGGRFHAGAGWRTLLTKSDDRTLAGVVAGQPGIRPLSIATGDVNGFVVSIGAGRRIAAIPPPPPNRPPTVSLDSDKDSVMSGEVVNFIARAFDPDNDPLTYAWSTTAGRLDGSGASAKLDTTGVNETVGSPPRDVTVTVTVDDGRGGTATASRGIKVNAPTPPPPPPPPPNRPPRIRSVNCVVIGTPQVEGRITDGESVRVRADAEDPDQDRLQYSFDTTAGKLAGSGNERTLDTTGVTSGPGGPPVIITVSVTVRDGRGGSDQGSCTVTVYPLPKPVAEKVAEPTFGPNMSRVDNVMKALLDGLAIRLQQSPGATLYLDGHTDKGEPVAVGLRRAENIKRYLVRDKGIDADRIVVRNFGSTSPDPSGERGKNRRVEIWFVPQGAEPPPGPKEPVGQPRRSRGPG